jgi:hypothetical protein
VAPAELRGVRRGRISTAGIIKSATDRLGPAQGGPGRGGDPEEGEIRLTLGTAVPSLGSVEGEDPEDDAALVAAGYASLTALSGVREDTASGADELVREAVSLLQSRLG